MADRCRLGGGAGEGRAHLADVGGDDSWVGAHAGFVGDAGGGYAVEVFGADGDAVDERGEIRAELGDGGGEGGDLVVHDVLAGRSPDADEEACAGVLCCLECGGRCVGCAALDGRVQAEGGESAICACEAFGCGELGGKIGGDLVGAVGER